VAALSYAQKVRWLEDSPPTVNLGTRSMSAQTSSKVHSWLLYLNADVAVILPETDDRIDFPALLARTPTQKAEDAVDRSTMATTSTTTNKYGYKRWSTYILTIVNIIIKGANKALL
jgi:hypothetical protein